MGFFSWKTQDTNKSIANKYSNRLTFTVYMKDDKGHVWKEDNYEGYGVFGGKDFYELLAEMNGEKTRDEGITLAYSNQLLIKSPNLVEHINTPYIDSPPGSCEFQGYFYKEENEEI